MHSILVVLAICFSTPVFASQLNIYGLGAKNESLANSGATLALDAFSQAYNPAIMAYQSGSHFSFSFQGANNSFEKISQVLIDTTTLGATSNVVGDVDTKAPESYNLAVGLQIPLTKSKEHPLNFGFLILSPADKILGINTEDSYLPQYSMYLSDTQHFNFGLNFSYTISPQLALGLGGQLYLVQAASTLFRFVNGGNSTARIRMDVRPGIAPVAGAIYSSEDGHKKIGISYWGKQDSRAQLDLNNYISTFSPTAILVTGKSSMYYDPETFVLSLSEQNDVNSVSVSVNWERWSDFAGSAMVLNFQTFNGNFSQNVPPAQFSDVVSYHVGYEQKWAHYSARIGYAYVPTPVPDQSGDLNYLDSNKHEVGLGFSFLDLGDIIGEKTQLDLAALVHYLMPKQVTKTSSSSIGYPGYKIGGIVYSYGLTLSSQF